MTAHELARLLLAGPDLRIVVESAEEATLWNPSVVVGGSAIENDGAMSPQPWCNEVNKDNPEALIPPEKWERVVTITLDQRNGGSKSCPHCLAYRWHRHPHKPGCTVEVDDATAPT